MLHTFRILSLDLKKTIYHSHYLLYSKSILGCKADLFEEGRIFKFFLPVFLRSMGSKKLFSSNKCALIKSKINYFDDLCDLTEFN